MKCCLFVFVFGAALDWAEADDIGFAWWVGQWHTHRGPRRSRRGRARDWYYEVVRSSV